MSIKLDKLDILQKGLDVSWKRSEIISNNIANAETPNFKASRLEFENVLKSKLGRSNGVKMKTSNNKHQRDTDVVLNTQPVIKKDSSVSMRLDGNNVDIENEMVEMAKNNLLYQTLIQKASKEVAKIKYAIREGR